MAASKHAYGEDLAYIHDAGYGGFAEGAAPGLLELLWQAGIENGRVVDLGCGSGIWARHLAAAGYAVTGTDISPAMIEMARQRVPRATFHVGSFLSFKFPPCRAVTALGEVLAYQFDKRNNAQALRRVCQRAFKALQTGGLLVVDLAEVGLDQGRAATFREGDGWACLVRFEYDSGKQQLARHIVTYRKTGKLYRRCEETHRIQLYEAKAVAGMLRQIGLRVRLLRKYGDYPLLKGRVGFVARKP